jgi:hypothetical protein
MWQPGRTYRWQDNTVVVDPADGKTYKINYPWDTTAQPTKEPGAWTRVGGRRKALSKKAKRANKAKKESRRR